jgi:hypothetical protein
VGRRNYKLMFFYEVLYLHNYYVLKESGGDNVATFAKIGCRMDDKNVLLELVCASQNTLSHKSRLHLRNPRWARVVGYSPFFLCVVHKEGLYPAVGMMIMMKSKL